MLPLGNAPGNGFGSGTIRPKFGWMNFRATEWSRSAASKLDVRVRNLTQGVEREQERACRAREELEAFKERFAARRAIKLVGSTSPRSRRAAIAKLWRRRSRMSLSFKSRFESWAPQSKTER